MQEYLLSIIDLKTDKYLKHQFIMNVIDKDKWGGFD